MNSDYMKKKKNFIMPKNFWKSNFFQSYLVLFMSERVGEEFSNKDGWWDGVKQTKKLSIEVFDEKS